MTELYGDVFDSLTGRSGRRVPDGLRRFVAAALFLALVAGMGVWAYRLGTRDAAEVPIIRAMEGPARIQPDDPGGLRAAHQGLEINAVLAGQPAPAPDLAAPLAPAPSVLADEDGPQGELVVAPPPEAVLAAGGDLRMPLQDDGPGLAGSDAVAPGAFAAAPMVAAALAELEQERAADLGAQAEGVRPMSRPSDLAVASAEAPPAAPSAAGQDRPAAAPSDAAPDAVQPGARLVQLGAFDSEAITRQAWNILASRNADLLGSKRVHIERTTANARVFYRLRVAGFDSADQTRQMCEALRARSVDCIPVTLP